MNMVAQVNILLVQVNRVSKNSNERAHIEQVFNDNSTCLLVHETHNVTSTTTDSIGFGIRHEEKDTVTKEIDSTLIAVTIANPVS